MTTEWQDWVGRTERREEVIDPGSLRRYAAALGAPVDIEQHFPSLGHWACFLPVAEAREIGPDGHPKRGGFLPPVPLPRRMFAGAEIEFSAPIVPGEPATRVAEIESIAAKQGSSGPLVLVGLVNRIEQAGTLRLTERQTLVYRELGAPTPAVVDTGHGGAWRPGPVELFRFSAATFNSHRIHYDLDYARDVEGYPGLVVHGPLTAARLFALAAAERQPRRFAFRAQAPLFAGQPITLRQSGPGTFEAVRCDNVVAMTATADH